jgi:hypothetical protein
LGHRLGVVGTGIFLIAFGAILAFAVRGDGRAVSLDTTGVILMAAGAACVYFASRARTHVHEVTREEDGAGHIVTETQVDKNIP